MAGFWSVIPSREVSSSWLFVKEGLHIHLLKEQVCQIVGISSAIHNRGGIIFRYLKKEIGHMHWNGDLDILFKRNTKSKLMSFKRVEQHAWLPRSGWITFKVKSETDIKLTMDLLVFSLIDKIKKNEPKLVLRYQNLILNSRLRVILNMDLSTQCYLKETL